MPRPAKRITEGSAVDRIAAWYEQEEGKVSLSEEEHEIKDRLELVQQLLHKRLSPRMVALKVMKLKGISKAQAYRDLNACNRLFGSLVESNKELDRQLIYEWALEGLRMARADRNLKEYNNAVRNLTKIKGLEREDSQLPDFEKLEQHNYVIIADPAMIGLEPVENVDQLLRQFKKKQQTIKLDPA